VWFPRIQMEPGCKDVANTPLVDCKNIIIFTVRFGLIKYFVVTIIKMEVVFSIDVIHFQIK